MRSEIAKSYPVYLDSGEADYADYTHTNTHTTGDITKLTRCFNLLNFGPHHSAAISSVDSLSLSMTKKIALVPILLLIPHPTPP